MTPDDLLTLIDLYGIAIACSLTLGVGVGLAGALVFVCVVLPLRMAIDWSVTKIKDLAHRARPPK